MSRNKNALKRAELFRRRVLELVKSLSIGDCDAIQSVADEWGYSFETGIAMFRGYGHYAGDVCTRCHNPDRSIVASGLCGACYQKKYRNVKSKDQKTQCLPC